MISARVRLWRQGRDKDVDHFQEALKSPRPLMEGREGERNTQVIQPAVVAQVFNPNTWETGQYGGLHREFQVSQDYTVRSYLKGKKESPQNSPKTKQECFTNLHLILAQGPRQSLTVSVLA